MAYIFYDTETTGTNQFFDQILQFAAIKTDDNFQVIDKINIRCKLLPFIIPSPGALLVTGIAAENLQKPELSFYQMGAKIREKLDEWGQATFIGYNSIRFDEPMLRQCFYQSLQPIFYTQLNGNKRADVMKLVQMAYHFNREAINFPVDESGNVRFKLDMLCPANGIEHYDAHDALSDVLATADLMKMIKDKSPEIYNSWWHASDKRNVENFLDQNEIFLTHNLHAKSNQKLVTKICLSSDGREGWLFDLSSDPELYFNLTDAELAKKIVKDASFLKIKVKEQPVIHECSVEDSDELVKLKSKAAAIKANPEFIKTFLDALQLIDKEEYSDEFTEQKIFSGFIETADEIVIRKFHNAEPNLKLGIIHEFQDIRLKTLAQRIMCVDYPEYVPNNVLAQFKSFISERLTSTREDVEFLTITKAKAEASKILEKDPSQIGFVDGYIKNLENLF